MPRFFEAFLLGDEPTTAPATTVNRPERSPAAAATATHPLLCSGRTAGQERVRVQRDADGLIPRVRLKLAYPSAAGTADDPGKTDDDYTEDEISDDGE